MAAGVAMRRGLINDQEIPCLGACPTGALDAALQDIDESRMGLTAVAASPSARKTAYISTCGG